MSLAQRPFGTSGLKISSLSLGTVELGVEYGLYREGERREPPDSAQAVAMLHRAFEKGVTFLDTAPAYGRSEELVGRALKSWREPIAIATKVNLPQPGEPPRIDGSIEVSLKALGKDHLELLQLHNPEASDLRDSPVLEALVRARDKGQVGMLGASVYGEEAALAAIDSGQIGAIQVALSLLDQRMIDRVLPRAREKGVAVIVRSALLKGVLSTRYGELPEHLDHLAVAAQEAEAWAKGLGATLAEGALRFCLSTEDVATVLVGVRSVDELDQALNAAMMPKVERAAMSHAAELALADPKLIDPRFWGIP